MKPKGGRKNMTEDEKKVTEGFERIAKYYWSWASKASPLWLVIEKQRIMNSWLAGKPVGA